MKDILSEIETSYIDASTLLSFLSSYQNPRDRISRMVKRGDLVRLKNGFFAIPRQDGEYPYEQIANMLYGPSYVSLEWALSFYGFIPERVTLVTSVTVGSRKNYQTPIGGFTYRHLSQARYSIGIDRKEVPGQLGGFLMATPEKALVDWVHFSCKGMSQKELLVDLLQAKRIEEESLQSLDLERIDAISHQYKSEVISKLARVLRKL